LSVALRFAHCFLKHLVDKLRRAFGCLVGNDLSVVQIHHRREIQLLSGNIELGDVRYPFLIGRGASN
jgi:hypothetical protein